MIHSIIVSNVNVNVNVNSHRLALVVWMIGRMLPELASLVGLALPCVHTDYRARRAGLARVFHSHEGSSS